jgi:hypothetical protein
MDIERLRAVARRYGAKYVVLAEWRKGTQPNFFCLKRILPKETHPRDAWELVDPGDIFR